MEDKILFIGNSLTYRQKFPHLFKNMVQQEGTKITVEQFAKPGISLLELSNLEELQSCIASKKWDAVVLQERTKMSLEDKEFEKFRIGANRIVEFIHINCKKTQIFYNVVWIGSNFDEEKQKDINQHYEIVAKQTNGKICYTGNAFLNCHNCYPEIDLFEDEKHPSLVGAYLSACCMYRAIYQKDPTKNRYEDVLNVEITKKLKEVAKCTIEVKPIQSF